MSRMAHPGAAPVRRGALRARRWRSPWLLLVAALWLSHGVQAQLLMSDDFNGYSNGSLSGQGSWVGLNASSLAFHVDDAAPVSYGCYSDGGRYVSPAAGSAPYDQRLSYPTTPFVASADQTFATALVINVAAAGSDSEAHVIGLGNDFGGARYEFLRVHVRSAGAGVIQFGLSKGSGLSLGGNAEGGIEWSTASYALGNTHLLVARYTHDNSGGAAGDALHLWVNPDLNSEPLDSAAAVVIAPGTHGNDTLFDGDTIRNVYLASRDQGGISPAFALDGLRHARGTTWTTAWLSLNASQNTSPTISTSASPLTVLGPTPFPVTVGDGETPAAALGVTALSANVALIPQSGIVVQPGGGDALRTITVTPAPGQFGTTTIHLTVTDGCGTTASTSVTVTVPGYAVTPSAEANGSISPDTVQTIAHGSTAQFTVTADADHTASVSGCGGTLAGNTFTTAPIIAACTVQADFVFNSFSVSPGAVNIGEVMIGNTGSASITLGNSGDAALDVTSLSPALPPFARTGKGSCSNTLPFTLAAHSTCTLNYRFAPIGLGSAQQTFGVLATAPGGGNFVLAGAGVAFVEDVFSSGFE